MSEQAAVKSTNQKTKAITIALMFSLHAFVADRIFKYIIMYDLYPTEVLKPGILAIVKHYNHGLMGNLPVPLPVNIGINLVALAVLIYALVQTVKRENQLESMALGFLLGGALGNLFDRVYYGYVFDWMMWFNLSIINFADVCIATGIIFYIYFHYRREGGGGPSGLSGPSSPSGPSGQGGGF